ncbi:DNA-invertase [Acetobacter indonesiensis NRIC 0313]|uniref:DNA invertase n=1 Tax=Acetobacter indonesiensis TaxID=104101 RepID=A0A6N3T6U1_9PROT|nr:recombinase family protein [Acetobacter indonesiensis]GAN62664.1 DNA recombinase/resolvase [Acetobacter indonesiensis]GBQ62120.1 DNA-invertase [Acetobacter indonesiensis NRIC 0313]GEN04593.1 DNA invertase [Acetobacter indonesiensis]
MEPKTFTISREHDTRPLVLGAPFDVPEVITKGIGMARFGYVRVSTEMQVNDSQVLALKYEGVETIITEVISGAVPARARPQLSNLLKRMKRGDSLVVSRLDRLGRDTLDVLSLLRELDEQGIRVRILNIGAETGTPNGRMFLTILMAIAEFERELIRERTRAGLAAVKASGKKLGRPERLTAPQKRHIVHLSHEGMSLRQIAVLFNVSKSTINRVINL